MSTSDVADKPLIAERYRVVRELGHGGMGVVYEVIDEKTNRRRALKRIRAHAALDTEIVRRFEQEVTVAGRIESDHVVEVFDAGVDEATQTPYLVMELLVGQDLGEYVANVDRLSLAQVAAIFEQLARALAKTHAEDVVHRDLKPENVFLTERDDGALLVKLLDFGVAKVLAADTLSPATTRVVGTPLYMAPEQFSGDGTIDGRADVYALGQMAFTMLVGSPFFETERIKRLGLAALAVAVASPERDAASARAEQRGVALPRGFDEWFAVATAAEPEARFDDALEAWTALQSVLDGRSAAPVKTISVRPRPSTAVPAETASGIEAANTIASTPPPDVLADTALASGRDVKVTGASGRQGRWVGLGAAVVVVVGGLFAAQSGPERATGSAESAESDDAVAAAASAPMDSENVDIAKQEGATAAPRASASATKKPISETAPASPQAPPSTPASTSAQAPKPPKAMTQTATKPNPATPSEPAGQPTSSATASDESPPPPYDPLKEL